MHLRSGPLVQPQHFPELIIPLSSSISYPSGMVSPPRCFEIMLASSPGASEVSSSVSSESTSGSGSNSAGLDSCSATFAQHSGSFFWISHSAHSASGLARDSKEKSALQSWNDWYNEFQENNNEVSLTFLTSSDFMSLKHATLWSCSVPIVLSSTIGMSWSCPFNFSLTLSIKSCCWDLWIDGIASECHKVAQGQYNPLEQLKSPE